MLNFFEKIYQFQQARATISPKFIAQPKNLMEALTTIHKILREGTIQVPSFQRAYSWDSLIQDEKNRGTLHTAIFLSDLEEHIGSRTKNPYYFGHFLFEKKGDEYWVIDGQQRLTTITIFLCALFARLNEVELSENDAEAAKSNYEDTVKRGRSTYRFSTVDYDNQFFRDYIVDQSRKDTHGLETESSKRIANAFNYFKKWLSEKDAVCLNLFLKTVLNASCTTHSISREVEAIQMFIFQNNRGKAPSNLEIVKAQFMYQAHLHGQQETASILSEIKSRFETIYKSISLIEYNIDEDDVLVYTQRVHFNSLWEGNAIVKINNELSKCDPIPFIKAFTHSLELSFDKLRLFFGKHEKERFEIHALANVGGVAIAIPFIIKAYRFGLDLDKISKLCASLEILVLRSRLIGTRASIESRINDVFEKFTEDHPDIEPIVQRIEELKCHENWWWAYWNTEALSGAIQGWIHPTVAKYLLWRYENYISSKRTDGTNGKDGYKPIRYNTIERPELEHIAPSTEPDKKPHGYGEYDDLFKHEYLDCLGNYLLVSKSHNCSIGNKSFSVKLADYSYLNQQRNVISFVGESGLWDKEAIQKRKEEIIRFVVEKC